MVVDRLESRDTAHGVERSARVRAAGQEHRLTFECPAELACAPEDATPFAAAALLPAMAVGEDLEVDGAVSPRLVRRFDRIQALYRAWNRTLRRTDVKVASETPPPASGTRVGAFFSRGADSMFTASGERLDDGPLDLLAFGETLEPLHDESVREHELRRARDAAEQIGLPLVSFRTNVRSVSDGFVFWSDYHGAGLAFAALAMGGGLRRMVVPATGWYGNDDHFGSSPLLDHLYSTEALAIEHGSLELGRADKVAWLARNRPGLLPYLKVCFAENRPDNCGRCPKCLITMIALDAAGGLDLATEFPDAIDMGGLRRMRMAILSSQIEWAEAAELLPDTGRHGEMRRLILRALRLSTRPSPALIRDRLRGRRPRARRSWTVTPSGFRRHQAREMTSLFVDGRPYWDGGPRER
jgi:hypothetical protein